MTRKSKREIERQLEKLDSDSRATASSGPNLDDRYPDDVVGFVHGVARDLLRICFENPDTIVNAPESEATERFLEIVREQYDIDEERDGDVVDALLASAEKADHWRPIDTFGTAPVAIATHLDVETAEGETLEELVDAGREQEAGQLLVGLAYDFLADRAGGHLEVTA